MAIKKANFPKNTAACLVHLTNRRAFSDSQHIDILMAMAKKTQTPPKNFEDALAELEKILADMEGSSVGLEESLQKYERGNFLIQHCRNILNSAEKQIEVLSKADDGGLQGVPLDEQAT